LERERARQLSGLVQLDGAYWGGRRRGYKRGRGTRGKTPFVAAVETDDEGRPQRMSFNKIRGFRSREIARWSQVKLVAGSTVHSDGLACFGAAAMRRAPTNARSSSGCAGISAARRSRKGVCRSRLTAMSVTS
jgi:hypothetical protein